MKGYYRKIFLYIACAVAVGAVFFLVNNGVLVERGSFALSASTTREDPVDAMPQEEMDAQKHTALVLYDPEEESSAKYAGNLERVLHRMDFVWRLQDAGQKDAVSYTDYDLVVVAFADWDGLLGEDCRRLLRYVEEGGRLFLGMAPYATGVVMPTLYRAMGVTEYGNYVEIEGVSFEKELLAGSQGRSFVDGASFTDTILGVQLAREEYLLAAGIVGERKVPMVWKAPYGAGQILTFNATAITGDFWTGVAGGCIATLFEDFLYPIINAKTVFLDDFPSPMYNTESETIQRDYNRSVREFFRDIWWPDMQSAATLFHVDYVGLFIATYDDIVIPDDFHYVQDSTEQYFGNSLLQNGFEMGAHGYNHQSLAGAGQVPRELGYNAWANAGDMAASLTELRQIAAGLFPEVKFYTYVPPSNYLSEEGRQAVVEALPDLQVISGVYAAENEGGSVYVQDYTVAEDGIVEYPRVTAGMLEDPYSDFAAMNACGLYGVFSHFVHPDDILDEERGGGLGWEALFESYCNKLNLVNEYYEGLRPLTAVEAAQAVRVAEALDVALTVEGETATGRCNGFTGEAFCYLRTDKDPQVDNESCRITPVCSDYEGCWYLVEILQPEFSFSLKEVAP